MLFRRSVPQQQPLLPGADGSAPLAGVMGGTALCEGATTATSNIKAMAAHACTGASSADGSSGLYAQHQPTAAAVGGGPACGPGVGLGLQRGGSLYGNMPVTAAAAVGTAGVAGSGISAASHSQPIVSFAAAGGGVVPSSAATAGQHACVSIGHHAAPSSTAPGSLNTSGSPTASPPISEPLGFAETDGIHTQFFYVTAGNRGVVPNQFNSTTVSLHPQGGELSGQGPPSQLTTKQGPTLWERVYLTMMPEGYPNSVTSDYLTHQIWDAFNFASYNVMATLATRAMLKGVGVGSSESTVLSGTLAWLLKDVSALLSSIGFAVKLANDLDNDAKQWRMFADITTDIGLLLEVYSEHLSPSLFTVVICIASMFRSVWTVAGWSSRVALTQHFAIRNNTADVSARNGAQETLFTLVGMLGGMYMAYLLGDASPTVQAFYFMVGTLGHLYFNYKSVKSLVLTNFNKHRALLCINRFMATSMSSTFSCTEANDLEPVMWWREPFITTFGSRPSELKGVVPPPILSEAVRYAMGAPEGRRFALIATYPPAKSTRSRLGLGEGRIRYDVVLREGAGDEESLWAFYLACKDHHQYNLSKRKGGGGGGSIAYGSHLIVASDTDGYAEFRAAALAAGWEMDKLQFRVFDWRVSDGSASSTADAETSGKASGKDE